jgi:hypothetical protein
VRKLALCANAGLLFHHRLLCRYTAEEIATELDELRVSMLAEQNALSEEQKTAQLRDQDDTHAMAERKEAELSKFAKAFGVKQVVRTPSCPPSSQDAACDGSCVRQTARQAQVECQPDGLCSLAAG